MILNINILFIQYDRYGNVCYVDEVVRKERICILCFCFASLSIHLSY